MDDEEILAVLERIGPRATTAEVAEQLIIKPHQTRVRLTQLMDEGCVDRAEIAGTFIWSRVE